MITKLQEKIVEVSVSYRNVEEEKNNSGFKQSWFLKLMLAVGWKKFESWCAYAAKSVWLQAFAIYDPIGAALIKKYANGSCVESYKNFRKSKEFKCTKEPVLGALVYFQHGTSTKGHAGVVTDITKEGYVFDSGNTNRAGSREGTTFLPKSEKLNKPFNPNGLNLLGFVSPIRIA